MYFSPTICICLTRKQNLVNARRKHFGTTTRHRLKTGFLQDCQRLLRRHFPAPLEVINLRCSEALDLNMRRLLVDSFDHLNVILKRPGRVMPSYDVNLVYIIVHMVQDFFNRHLVSVTIAWFFCKITELTTEHAYVGRIHMAVENEVDLVTRDPFFCEVCHSAHPR